MSMTSSEQANVKFKSKEMADIFQKHRDTILHHHEDFSLSIDGDCVNLCIAAIDEWFCCPQNLDEVVDSLVELCVGDEGFVASETDKDLDKLAVNYGDIVLFAAELFRQSEELISSLSYLHWKVEREDYGEGIIEEQFFTFDKETGEKYEVATYPNDNSQIDDSDIGQTLAMNETNDSDDEEGDG